MIYTMRLMTGKKYYYYPDPPHLHNLFVQRFTAFCEWDEYVINCRDCGYERKVDSWEDVKDIIEVERIFNNKQLGLTEDGRFQESVE